MLSACRPESDFISTVLLLSYVSPAYYLPPYVLLSISVAYTFPYVYIDVLELHLIDRVLILNLRTDFQSRVLLFLVYWT